MIRYLCSSCGLRKFVCSSQSLLLIKSSRFRIVPTELYPYRWPRNCFTRDFSTCNDVESTKKIAHKLGIEDELFVDSLKNCPDLLHVSSNKWESCFRELMNNGLSAEETLYVITKYPPLLLTNVKDFSTGFKYWRGVELGEKNVLSLLKTCPQFLLVRGQQISLRVAHLKTVGSDKAVVKLLKNAPRLMFDNWNDVLAKLSFLIDEMRIERKQVLKSYALNRDLLFLKSRFVFLERCGKYVKPKLDPDPNIPSKNPPLKSIVEEDDETFSTQVAGVTLEEYEVFQELYTMEVAESEMDSDSE
ncbi:hypothetical protein R5R35_006017 [Gryllus longicercus]|uniref:Mitochondrial transcription termination factor n=1 Tax=Gryllus longicercus TaxID=2509291 RepID=A0AAN9VRI7_9ORTH